MLDIYLYDTSSVQDRLFERSHSSGGKVGQTADGKIGQSEKDVPGGNHKENVCKAGKPL